MINFSALISPKLFKITLPWAAFGLLLLVGSCDFGSNNSMGDGEKYPALDSVDVYLQRSKEPGLTKEESLAHLSEALNFTRNLKKDTVQRAKLSEIRKEYFGYNELEAYRSVNDEIRILAEELDDSLEIANSYFKLGYYYFRKEKVDSAYNNYYLAERMYERINDPFNTGKALLSMAILQKNVKDYVGSESSSVRAIEYFTPLDDLRYLASANSNLAIISKDLGKYEEAIEYNQKALEFRKKLKSNKTLQVSSLNNIGIVHSSNGQYQEAIKYFNRGLVFDSLFQKRPLTYIRLLDNLAYAKFLSGETEGFPELLLHPLFLRDSLQDNSGTITSYLHLANYYKTIDSIPKANYYAEKALKTSERLQYQSGKLESLLLLSETSEVHEAIDYTKSYIRITDSLQAQERAYRDQFARIRFETEKIETENTAVTRRNKQLFIGLLSLLAIFLLVYIIIQKKLNQKEMLFRESQQKANEEIYNLMLAQQLKLEEGKQLEKRRFSEELHDGVLGRLFGARLSLDSLNTKYDEDSVQARLKYLEELKSIETEIRQISHGLNSTIFSRDVLFTEVIEQLIEIQNTLDSINPSKYQFINDYIIHWEEMPNNIKVHLYRIVQEALQNIHKHAMAKNGTVSFIKEKDDILLRIEDDGLGMVTHKVKKGIGLKNIKSRVEQMKGILKVDSEKGRGTTITVKISS